MNSHPILTPRHPETGQARAEVRESLFALLAITVALGAVLNALINHVGAAAPGEWRWWAWLVGLVAAGALLVGLGITHDDRRVGQTETEIELLLPYLVRARGRVDLGERRSYAITLAAREAWRAAWGEAGLELPDDDKGPFTQRILPYHMDLARYLLTVGLAHYGREREPGAAWHSWLRPTISQETLPWAELPERLRENTFAQAVGRACPKALALPAGAQLTADMEGDCLIRLSWRWRRWLPWGPRGELRLRWLGPLSETKREDKRYELLTARLHSLESGARCHVVVTRLTAEVDTRWNFLASVAGFRDWALNLTHRLQQRMDYSAWWEYLLQRTVVDLDWKIGWIEKGGEPGMAERLRRVDDRLARLEEHLWPDELPTGDTPGAWLSAPSGESQVE